MQAGEQDYWDAPSQDLIPILKADPNIVVDTRNPTGNFYMLQLNHAQPPFNNPKVRQALAMAIDQNLFLKAVTSDPKLMKPCYSFYGSDSPYFTEAGYFLYANTTNLRPGLELHLPRSVVLTANVALLWRTSTEDSLYGPALQPFVAPVGSRRYIGTMPTVEAWWNVDRHLSLVVNYSHLFDGPFLRDSGVRDLSFFALWATYLF